jgi:hypothetical protein
MTDNDATPANNPARPSLKDCQTDAVILMGLLEAIDLLDNEGHTNAMTSVVSAAYALARRLSDDLDGVKEAKA